MGASFPKGLREHSWLDGAPRGRAGAAAWVAIARTAMGSVSGMRGATDLRTLAPQAGGAARDAAGGDSGEVRRPAAPLRVPGC
jgi:hypothetical protein